MVSGVSKNRDYLGLLLRLMVSERPEGDEEGRWREPCTRCPLKRAQRWWEKGKNSTLWCACRATEHPRLITKADVQTQKGSKLAPVNSRVKRNSNKSQNRDATSHWWQVTKYPSTDQIRSKASSREREGHRRDALTQATRWIQISHCTGNIVPPGYKGRSQKADRKLASDTVAPNLLELSRRR